MTPTVTAQGGAAPPRSRAQTRLEGIQLLVLIVSAMWIVEVVNALDNYRLDSDGIHARDPGRLWGIFTSPFLHAGFGHLLSNTIPLVFMGVIIALKGAGRLAAVSLIVIVIGGLGTWLIAPAGTSTIGASGVVFGYATYLLARGFFDRSALELVTGLIVGVIWGGVLLASLVPHQQISWQAHLCGAIGGVVAAWLLAARRRDQRHAGAATAALGGRTGRQLAK